MEIMSTILASDGLDDPGLTARIGAITNQILKNLPHEGEQREQTLLERALRYAAETEQQMAEQRERIAELENLSFTDPLTGLLNRRGFENHLAIKLRLRPTRTGIVGAIPLPPSNPR